jgi:replicative DNA helicase
MAHGKGVLVISLEMPASQIIDRLVAKLGQIPLRALAEGIKTEAHANGLHKAMTILRNSSLVVRDDLHDIASIVATARSMAKSETGLSVLMVDYIQLVRCELGRDSTREREVAEVSRALRLLGLELGCLVIGITQLNEQGKARESRAIQQDATSILAIKLDQNDPAERRTIGIPYQRNGPCGVETSMRFNGRTASFHEA